MNMKQTKLTSTKCDHAGRGGTEQARVDAIELSIDDVLQLGIARRLFAEERRGHDAANVERVARVLAVRHRVGDQGLLILDPWLLGEIDHRIRVVLLRAGVRIRQQRADPVFAREDHARVVVRRARAAALLAEGLPALRDLRQVGLRDAFFEEVDVFGGGDLRDVRRAFLAIALGLACGWGGRAGAGSPPAAREIWFGNKKKKKERMRMRLTGR